MSTGPFPDAKLTRKSTSLSGVEILAQERAKDLELGDLPPPTEGCQISRRDPEPLAK